MVGLDDGRDTEYGGNARGNLPRRPSRSASRPGRPGVTGRAGSAIGGTGRDSFGQSVPLSVGEEARLMRMQGMHPDIAPEPSAEEIRDELIEPGIRAEQQRQRERLDQITSRYWRERQGE